MPELITIANEFEKIHSICTKCGDPAYYTQRLINGKPAHYVLPFFQLKENQNIPQDVSRIMKFLANFKRIKIYTLFF